MKHEDAFERPTEASTQAAIPEQEFDHEEVGLQLQAAVAKRYIECHQAELDQTLDPMQRENVYLQAHWFGGTNLALVFRKAISSEAGENLIQEYHQAQVNADTDELERIERELLEVIEAAEKNQLH